MKKIMLIIMLALLLVPTALSAEYYHITVTRVDENLYKSSEGIFIVTKYCYEYANGEDVVLIYDPYVVYGNKLVFSNRGTTCEVKKVFR